MIGMQVLLVHVLCAQTLLGYNGSALSGGRRAYML